MGNWSTASSLATGAGTLVLAIATFASVRSANRAARVAEVALRAGLRPFLVPSRSTDPAEKIRFVDDHWVKIAGGRGSVEVTEEAVYLTIALHNAGSGLAVLHGWHAWVPKDSQEAASRAEYGELDQYRRLTRDLYIPAGHTGFWQGAVRDRADPLFDEVRKGLLAGRAVTVFLLYGDDEGGQRTVTRFHLEHLSGAADNEWFPSVSRHWNLDRPNPR